MEIVHIHTTDQNALAVCRQLILEHAWGRDYPVDPMTELSSAEYVVGAYGDSQILGCAYVSRCASPDGVDNGELWIGGAVVHPDFRNRGIFRMIYASQMKFVLPVCGRILSCTSNSIVREFFHKEGWTKVRETVDEGGEFCEVYEFLRVD